MRVLGHADNARLIELSDSEAAFLRDILDHYPIVTNDDRELTRTGEEGEYKEDTEWLRSNLSELTQSNQRRLRNWINSEETLLQLDSGWQLHVADEDCDWILQVLNDLRIGSWRQLGCPDPDDLSQLPLDASTVRPLWTMELCGLLQTFLLNHH